MPGSTTVSRVLRLNGRGLLGSRTFFPTAFGGPGHTSQDDLERTAGICWTGTCSYRAEVPYLLFKVHFAFLTLAVAQGLRQSATQTHTSDRYEELETFILSSSQRIPAHLGRAQSALHDKQLAILETVTGFHLALMGRY